ncbi:tyrosyl-DNA phosphodiesterase I [Nemania sp. NC0429]|nr:tyrosyl-DNA phosphodiesterase I [Nemania sp. NC0429]
MSSCTMTVSKRSLFSYLHYIPLATSPAPWRQPDLYGSMYLRPPSLAKHTTAHLRCMSQASRKLNAPFKHINSDLRLLSPPLSEVGPRIFHTLIRATMSDKQRVAPGALKRKADTEIDEVEEIALPRKRKQATSPASMTYPNGAIRITRTPGRKHAKNCVNLSDIIHKNQLVSACIYSFFIAEDELYPHLPLSHSSSEIPIYIGRDPNFDVPAIQEATTRAGLTFQEKVSRKQLDILRPALQQLHSQRYGQNIRTFYAWGSGSCHSKILLLVYPTFLRIVITSCNMMDIDTELGDNHWYIHDVPKRSSRSGESPAGFEADLLAHMTALGTPETFLDSIRGVYDYSTVKVHLITSVPGTSSGAKAEQHGLLRLRRAIRQMDLKLPEKARLGALQIEVCAASIGNLSAKWLNGFYDCVIGRDELETHDEARRVPNIKLFYPTMQDVRSADKAAQDGASNIGCHIRQWEKAPVEVKRIFHHYQSKDRGKLFHQKFILAYDARDAAQLPYYLYIGSANLSQAAWGALEHDRRGNEPTSDMKLVKLTNFECGVLVPGHLIQDLLEEGTESWQEGAVPHVQDATPYDLSRDKAWNDYRWSKDYRESQDNDSGWTF